MDDRWRIELLGGLRGVKDGQEVTRFHTRKSGALLGYLAYHLQHAHPREVLAELLWPDVEPCKALNSLSQALGNLRGVLEPPGAPAGSVIEAKRRSVQLNSDAVVTDVTEFDAALRAATEAEDRAIRLPRWRRAIELYRGPLLDGHSEGWILPEREWLADRFFAANSGLIALLKEAGELPRAIEVARRAVCADPLREESYRELMGLLDAVGQPNEALQVYTELERRLRQDLGSDPDATTRGLVEAIRRHVHAAPLPWSAPPRPPPASRHSDEFRLPPGRLPRQYTPFFGREREKADLWKLLGEESPPVGPGRLVTLTGPGGIGKTRLALEVARQMQEVFDGTIRFVSLVDLHSADAHQVPDRVREALGLPHSPDVGPLQQIIAELSATASGARPALLLLDNVEHLLPEAATFVATLRDEVETLRLLVTSRQRLNLPGERELLLPPLSTPCESDSLTSLSSNDSVSLFMDRAKARRPDFGLNEANANVVAALCRRLEGIPLALELAAARADVQTPAQILADLERRPDLMRDSQPDADPRHRSMWRVLAGSYDLLSPELQRLFRALSVFRGGWALAAARAVLEVPDERRTLEYLQQLRERSLITAEEQDQEMRFRMLDTVREFAAEQLTPQEAVDVARRHLDHFLALAEGVERELYGPDQKTWSGRLEQEHDNLRAALESCRHCAFPAETGLRLGAALSRFWWMRGHLTEGGKHLSGLLARPDAQGATAERSRALHGAGLLAAARGELPAARALHLESLSISRELGLRAVIAASLNSMGNIALAVNDGETARLHFEESLQIARALGDDRHLAIALNGLAGVAMGEKRYEEARAHYEESLRIREVQDDAVGGAYSLNHLGAIAHALGDLAGARDFRCRALKCFRQVGHPRGVVICIEGLAGVAGAHGHEKRAARLFGAARAARAAIGGPRNPKVRDDLERRIADLRSGMDQAAFAAAWAEGAAMSMDEAAAYVLEEWEKPESPH